MSSDKLLQEQYTVEVSNQFNPLEDEVRDLPIHDKYTLLSKACIEAGNILPKKPRKTLNDISQSPAVKQARLAMQEATLHGKDLKSQRRFKRSILIRGEKFT